MQHTLDRFRNHLSVAGCAHSTAVNYVRVLRDAQRRFDQSADELGRDQLLAFLAERRRHCSSSTLNTQVCALKYYYREVARRLDLLVDIPNPRTSKALGDLLSPDEARKLLRAARSLRHQVVLELLFGLGLRASEVGRLRLGDFNRQERTLTVRTSKGGVTRVLPYGDHLRQTLVHYFRAERPRDHLVPSRDAGKGGGISVRGVQHIVRQTLGRSGLRKHVNPHTLRHCFAVHYLNNGGNILRLQQLLGHTYLSSTLRYLSYATFRLADISSPLDVLYGSAAAR